MRDIGNIKIITGAELAIILADNTQVTVDSEHISMNGIVLDDSTSVDGQFTIGAAVTGQLTITILNEDDSFSPYNFRDATCQLTLLGIAELPDDEDEELQEDSVIIGQYNIVDYTYDGSDITLTAYDNLCKFDIPCTETRGETISFPKTLTDLIQTAARICQVTLASPSTPIPNGSYSVTQKPEQWSSMTWHDVISYCAQLGGVYAKTDKYGRVFFDWYDINAIPQGYDGGTFDTKTTPYSDGAELNGGDFTYTTADSADGGNFNYPTNMHFIDSPYSLTVATDDVYITGLKVVLAASDNINANENTTDFTTLLYGTDGYVITISGNPFIQTTTQANTIKDFLGAVVVGMWFRPLNVTVDDDLTVEAGDQAYVIGVNGNTYQCFVSHVTYTTNSATVIACDAEPNSSSEKTRFTAADKMAAHVAQIQRRVEGVSKIAGNTNQYFWHTETGTDTGAHITEVQQEEWSDPDGQNYHSGGNVLIRSNGIAIRDGLTELTTMDANGIQIGTDNGFRVVIGEDSIELLDSAGTTGFGIDLVGGSTDRIISNTYNYSASTAMSNTFNAPISTKTITFRLSSNGHTYTATKTASQLSINSSFTLGSTTSDYLEITRTGTDSFSVDLWVAASGTTGSASLQVSYTVTRSTSTITYTGDNKVLWSGTGLYMSEGQSVTLSEPIKNQLSGIVLVWSAYVNGSSQNYDWFYQYIPKDHVIARNGQGVTTGLMINGSGTYAGVKYVYVSNDRITGNANNATSQSGSGISLQNTHWVLRYVIGV